MPPDFQQTILTPGSLQDVSTDTAMQGQGTINTVTLANGKGWAQPVLLPK